MAVNISFFQKIKRELQPFQSRLVAVSKTKPVEDIQAFYEAGQRAFGENYVQELVQKQSSLPDDIEWHFIGHLQSNKVKYIASFISMIQSVDNLKLLKEINKQAGKKPRTINCLLQVHVAKEETKFGLDKNELMLLLKEVISHPDNFQHVRLCGLMGMATNTKDETIIRSEFHQIKELQKKIRNLYGEQFPEFKEISMGMSSDYKIALEEGSTIIRIGSLLFGSR